MQNSEQISTDKSLTKLAFQTTQDHLPRPCFNISATPNNPTNFGSLIIMTYLPQAPLKKKKKKKQKKKKKKNTKKKKKKKNLSLGWMPTSNHLGLLWGAGCCCGGCWGLLRWRLWGGRPVEGGLRWTVTLRHPAPHKLNLHTARHTPVH